MNEFINAHWYLATLIVICGAYMATASIVRIFALFVILCASCDCKAKATKSLLDTMVISTPPSKPKEAVE